MLTQRKLLMDNKYSYIIACISGIIIGLSVGYNLYHTKVIVETDKKQIIMNDTSVVIKRVTDTILVEKLAKVDGTTVLHNTQIKIKAIPSDTVCDTLIRNDTVWITKTIDDSLITVTLAILKDKDNGLRVQAKVKNGIVVGSIDIPRETYIFSKPLDNIISLHGMYGLKDSGASVSISYDKMIGPFVVGGLVGTHIKQPENIIGGINLGLRF